MRIPLIGGSNPTRSIIAGTASSINLYPEVNPPDAAYPYTLYPRPGLTPILQGPVAPVRGLWRSSDGQGWCVIGSNLYFIASNFILTFIGTISSGVSTPVTFIDNGTYLIVVDDSTNGWKVKLSDHSGFGLVSGFPGATDMDFVDGYFIYASPNSNLWGSSLFNSITFDPTYVAEKLDWPDHIAAVLVNQREILLLGTLKSSMYYNAGNPTFPFAELPGAYFEHGLAARYGHAWNDISAFWLSQNLQGTNFFMRQRGYTATRVSNFGFEIALKRMPGFTDAIAFSYGYAGHSFVMVQFPAANQTWVFDDSIPDTNLAWHQETSYDPTTQTFGRHRANCVANLYGKVIMGDYENGLLYVLDDQAFTDNGQPILRTQTFQHVRQMPDASGQPVELSGKRIQYQNLTMDGECGIATDYSQALPQFSLSWSDNRGRTFNTPVLMTAGHIGDYLTFPKWQGPLGIARDRIYKLDFDISGPAAINGVWVEGEVLDS